MPGHNRRDPSGAGLGLGLRVGLRKGGQGEAFIPPEDGSTRITPEGDRRVTPETDVRIIGTGA